MMNKITIAVAATLITIVIAAAQTMLNYVPVNRAGDSMLGKLTTLATSSANAGLNLPHGTSPSTAANGDIWTTTSGFFAQINGAAVGPMGASGLSVGTTAVTSGNTNCVLFNNSSILGCDTGATYAGGGAVFNSTGGFGYTADTRSIAPNSGGWAVNVAGPAAVVLMNGTRLSVRSTMPVAWANSTDPTGTVDVGISRDSIGAIDVGNGTQGDISGTIKTSGMVMGGTPTISIFQTGAGTQTFTNSPCTTLNTERWIKVQIVGSTSSWFVPACN